MKLSEVIKRLEKLEKDDREVGLGATREEIRQAEMTLGVRFPNSYRTFLKRLGWASIGHYEIFGLGQDVPSHLHVVRNTLDERNLVEPSMPFHLVPIMNDGAGNHYCLDTAHMKDGECPVVFWSHELGDNQESDEEAANFAVWLNELINEILKYEFLG